MKLIEAVTFTSTKFGFSPPVLLDFADELGGESFESGGGTGYIP